MNSKILLCGIILLMLFLINPALGEDGKFVVSSDPYEADVSFDGTNVGTTAVTIPVGPDNPPPHTITVSKEGYQTWEQTYQENPEPGYPILVSPVLVMEENPVHPLVTVLPPLTPPVTIPTQIPITPPATPIGGDYGWFAISSNPSGGDVIFNGRYVGDSPVTVKVMTTGTPTNTIEVNKQGYKNWYQEYHTNPGSGQTIQVYAELVAVQTSGSISVLSDPSGAYATIDRGYQLITPCTFTSVNPGYHTIALSMAGYQQYNTRILVQSGQESSVTATLTPTQQVGTLQASSSPSGADLYVDTGFRGNTPLRVSGLSAGTHTVSMERSGFQDWSQTVSIIAGQTTTINPVLSPYPPEPKTGDIAVSSIPAGAYVYLDNNYQGVTSSGQSLDITSVSPGTHTVLLEHPHYQDYTTTVQISAGATTEVSATLVAPPEQDTKSGILIVSSDPSGADIYLNNQYMGITPASLQNIQAGSYTLLLRQTGYNDYADTIEIRAGSSTQVSTTLTPLVTPTSTPLPTQTPIPVSGADFPVLLVLGIVILCLIAVVVFLLLKNR